VLERTSVEARPFPISMVLTGSFLGTCEREVRKLQNTRLKISLGEGTHRIGSFTVLGTLCFHSKSSLVKQRTSERAERQP